MKKMISVILVLILVATTLVGCTKPAGAPEGGKIVKVGLGQNIDISKSRDAGKDANGKDVMAQGQADVTMAAVGFDKDGKVVSVTVDVAQTRVAFDSDLKVSSDKAAANKTKKELGPDYGMVGNSEIKKEWFEQMAAFEAWMVGKTADEIKNLKVKEANPTHKNVPDVPELTSSVTITVEGYIAAVVEAWEKAVEVAGAETIGLGVTTSIGSSRDAGKDANGKDVLPRAQVDTTMSAVAFDKDGKVVKSIVDVAQVRVEFDADGKVSSDKAATIKTKKELGPDYGMVGNSEIKKEWFEQMAAFEDWMVGKSVADITGLKVKEANPTHKNVPDVPELTSSVTITVESYLAAVAKSNTNKR